MNPVLRWAAVAASSLALLVATATPSEAAGKASFDVTSLKAKDIVVGDSSCVRTDVTMKHTKKNVTDWYVTSNIYGRNGLSNYAWYDSYSNPSKDRVQVCPSWDGLGKYTIGPSEIDAYNYDFDDYGNYGSVERADGTKGHFYVRGKASAKLSAKRSGSTVTLSITGKRYSPESYGWVKNNAKATIQVKSGSKWKTVKTVTLKNGAASHKLKSKGAKQYRAVLVKTDIAVSATSKTVKK